MKTSDFQDKTQTSISQHQNQSKHAHNRKKKNATAHGAPLLWETFPPAEWLPALRTPWLPKTVAPSRRRGTALRRDRQGPTRRPLGRGHGEQGQGRSWHVTSRALPLYASHFCIMSGEGGGGGGRLISDSLPRKVTNARLHRRYQKLTVRKWPRGNNMIVIIFVLNASSLFTLSTTTTAINTKMSHCLFWLTRGERERTQG